MNNFYSNSFDSSFNMRNIVKTINQKLKQSPNESIKQIFEETQTVLSLKQPPNLLRLLSINRKKPMLPQGLFNCNNKNCKLCTLYTNPAPVSRLQLTLFGILGVT